MNAVTILPIVFNVQKAVQNVLGQLLAGIPASMAVTTGPTIQQISVVTPSVGPGTSLAIRRLLVRDRVTAIIIFLFFPFQLKMPPRRCCSDRGHLGNVRISIPRPGYIWFQALCLVRVPRRKPRRAEPRLRYWTIGYGTSICYVSFNHARRCLTSVIGREPVFST